MQEAFNCKLVVEAAALTANIRTYGALRTEEFHIPYRQATGATQPDPAFARVWLMNTQRSSLPDGVRIGIQWESFDRVANEWTGNGSLEAAPGDQQQFVGLVGDLSFGLNRIRAYLISDIDVSIPGGGSGHVHVLVVPTIGREEE